MIDGDGYVLHNIPLVSMDVWDGRDEVDEFDMSFKMMMMVIQLN